MRRGKGEAEQDSAHSSGSDTDEGEHEDAAPSRAAMAMAADAEAVARVRFSLLWASAMLWREALNATVHKALCSSIIALVLDRRRQMLGPRPIP